MLYYFRYSLLIFSLSSLFQVVWAHNSVPSLDPCKKQVQQDSDVTVINDPLQDTFLPWSISFGTTQLFENWFGESKLNLPVSSATLMLARYVSSSFKTWLIFNLPLVPSQRINADGQARFSPNPPVMIVGASYILMNIKLKRDNHLEAEVGIYGGRILDEGGLYFPLGAARLSVVKKDDVAVYLGLSASMRVDTLGLIYGVEHRF
jgi:hypothetical protein